MFSLLTVSAPEFHMPSGSVLAALSLASAISLIAEVALEPVLGRDEGLDEPVLDALHRDLVEVAGADEQLLARSRRWIRDSDTAAWLPGPT